MKISSLCLLKIFLPISILLTSCSNFQLPHKGLRPIIHIVSNEARGLPAKNSLIIEGEKELLLINTQDTVSMARKVVKKLKRINKPLTKVFITSATPENYLGSWEIRKYFPQASYLASPHVIRDLKKYGRKIWANQARFLEKNNLQQESVRGPLALEALEGNLDFESLSFEVIERTKGTSVHHALLYNRTWAIFLAGDLIFQGIHGVESDLYPKAWLKALSEIKDVPLVDLYAGNGPKANKDLLLFNIHYLEKWIELIELGLSDDKIRERLKALYPELIFPQ